MTYGAFTARDLAAFERGRARSPLPQAVVFAIALALSTAGGLWLLYGHPANAPSQPASSRPTPAPVEAPVAARPEAPHVKPRIAMLDPSLMSPDFTAGYAPVPFGQGGPVASTFDGPQRDDAADAAAASALESAAPEADVVPHVPAVSALVGDIPLPAARPVFVPPAEASVPQPPMRRRLAARAPEPGAPAAPADRPSFFDRLFGKPQAGPALAYAAPEDGGLGILGAARVSAPDRYTAVYDIAAHTVTLPDGTRLEAHSGLGANKDNPRSVAEHMRGATPPAVYDLQPREALFHGVRALRLNPVGDIPYGRMGLLAHSYMLGPRGDSNGCVVFRDYAAFRQAYDNGAIRRLVVVAGRG